MSIELSQSEWNVLTAIQRHIRQYGQSPSSRELCEATGISSTSVIHYNLAALEECGLITRQPGRSRTIVLCGGTVAMQVRRAW